MSNVEVQSFPTRVTVSIKGTQGPPGAPGDVTPELQELADESAQSAQSASSFANSASQSAEAAASNAGMAAGHSGDAEAASQQAQQSAMFAEMMANETGVDAANAAASAAEAASAAVDAVTAYAPPIVESALNEAISETDWSTVLADSAGQAVPALEFAIAAGTPTLNTTSFGLPMWLLSPNSTQVIGASANLGPRTPELVDVDIEWTNTTSQAGSVQIQVRWAAVGDGANLAAISEANSTKTLILTAPGQRRVRRTNVASAVRIPPGATRFTVRTTGVGTLAANQIGFIKIVIRPVSRLASSRRMEYPLPGTLNNTYNNNSGAFIRDNVVTVGNNRYAVWVDAARKPIIGKSVIAGGVWGAWQTFDMSTIAGNPLGSPVDQDGHNTFSIGIEPDGRIQVSGDHHDDPLKIVRSATAADITAWAVPDVGGIPEANRNSITYPQFLTSPLDGSLWLVVRQGGSGNGAYFINKWDPGAQRWNHVSRPISGFVVDGAAQAESPYANTPCIGPDGRWGIFYMWRLTDDLATTHDFGYIRSSDATATSWQTAAGAALPATTLPQHTAPLIFTGFADQINQCGAAVDSSNRPHTVMWVRNPATSGPSFLRHYWWDGAAWRQDDLVNAVGASPTFRSRPQTWTYGNRVFCHYSDFPVIGVDGAVPPRSFTRWWIREITPGDATRLLPFVFLDEDLGNAELPFDWRGLSGDGRLNLLVTKVGPNGDTGGIPGLASMPGRVISLDIPAIIAFPPQ